ncbi:vacuolar protein sorting-associated protein 13, partial [Kipferlia bialata]
EPFLLHTGTIDIASCKHSQRVGVPCIVSMATCSNRLSKAVSVCYRVHIVNYSHDAVGAYVGPPGNADRETSEYGYMVVPRRSSLPFTKSCRCDSRRRNLYVHIIDPSVANRDASRGPVQLITPVPGVSPQVPFGVSVDTEGVYDMLLPLAGVGDPRRVSVKVDIEDGQTFVRVFASPPHEPAPYRITSLCSFSLCVYQSVQGESPLTRDNRDSGKKVGSPDALSGHKPFALSTPTVQTRSVPSYTVMHGQMIDLVLYDANLPPVLCLTSTGSSTVIGHMDLSVFGSVYEHASAENKVFSVLVFDGSTRHVYLCPTLDIATGCLKKHQRQSGLGCVSGQVQLEMCIPRLSAFMYTSMQMGPLAKRVETLCLTLEDVKASSFATDGTNTVTFSLGGLQLDNQAREDQVLYPVVLRLAARPQVEALLSNSKYTPDRRGVRALAVSLVGLRRSGTTSRSVLNASMLNIRLDGACIAVEQCCLEAMSSAFKRLSLRLALSAEAVERRLMPALPTHPGVRSADPLYLHAGTGANGQLLFVERLHIDSAPVCVSVKMTDVIHLTGGYFESMINAGISGVVAAENALVNLPALKARSVFGTLDQVKKAVLGFYVRSFSRDVLGILGVGISTSLLGNAPRALNSLSAGAAELKSSDSALEGLKEFSRHSAAAVTTVTGNVSGSVADALVRATSNQRFTDRHIEALAASRESFTGAVLHSVAGFYDGIITGVSGVAITPYREVRAKGPKGIFGGVRKGMTGLVTGPMAGIANAFAYTSAYSHSRVSVASLHPMYTPVVRAAGDELYRSGAPEGEEERERDTP